MAQKILQFTIYMHIFTVVTVRFFFVSVLMLNLLKIHICKRKKHICPDYVIPLIETTMEYANFD